MIQRTLKKCKSCGQETVIWGHGRCRRCDALYKANKASTLIKPRTDKRKQQEAEYKKICDEIDREAIENKQTECLFCGKPIKGRADHHHIIGRDGDKLTEKKYIKRAHHKCHMDYHGVSAKKILWWDGYLLRVKKIDEKVYLRDLWKLDK